jgi:hypothetical protein
MSIYKRNLSKRANTGTFRADNIIVLDQGRVVEQGPPRRAYGAGRPVQEAALHASGGKPGLVGVRFWGKRA